MGCQDLLYRQKQTILSGPNPKHENGSTGTPLTIFQRNMFKRLYHAELWLPGRVANQSLQMS